MSVREITLWPNRDLITMATPAILNEQSASALENLEDTMRAAQGVGLAATQVSSTWSDGLPSALIVVMEDTRPAREVQGTIVPPQNRRIWKLANPKIIARSEEKLMRREGCLSIPDYYERVERHWGVTVEADVLRDGTWEFYGKNTAGGPIVATGLFAHALQHEIEHLVGGFFVTEHGSQLKIDQAKRYVAKRWGKRGVTTWRPGPPTKEEQEKMMEEARARALARMPSRRGFRR